MAVLAPAVIQRAAREDNERRRGDCNNGAKMMSDGSVAASSNSDLL
nr:hypothetical protein [uncultured Campylobacter sp.]